MTLRLVIEHSPHPQARREVRHEEGDLTIGRGADCDWTLDDPDMFISRRHCVISARDGQYRVTDASRGGLYLDGADRPLGPGNSATLEPGMRLRLGDVVVRVEMEAGAGAATTPQPADVFQADGFFQTPGVTVETPPRPADLPEPFESGRPSAGGVAAPPPRDRAGPAFDDPFTLDPVATSASSPARAAPAGDDFWSGFPAVSRDPAPDAPARADFALDTAPAESQSAAPQSTPPAATPTPQRADPRPAAVPPASNAALAAAFLKGAGLSPDDLAPKGTPAEMEELGRRFRLLAEGLVVLLRARAKEKGSARLAQTVIGATDVNPLKFLPTTDEAIAALIRPRGKGYLAPEEAINAAFRDISDHQMRSWVAIQAALRRMIDRFDPAQFEAEADKDGLMKSILAGGRGTRLWQLYGERYREIAKAAEDRFLGEVGADFRDAYESRGRIHDD